MREIRTLRSKRRELETGLRTRLIGARHARKGGYRGRLGLRDTAPALDPTVALQVDESAEGRGGHRDCPETHSWGPLQSPRLCGE